MIMIRILQKIFHLIGSLCFGTNQSCIKQNCLKDVNIVQEAVAKRSSQKYFETKTENY